MSCSDREAVKNCHKDFTSPLKSGVFFGTFVCTGKGYVERGTSLASLEKKWGTFQGSLCSPLKSGGFFGTFVCTGKGYIMFRLPICNHGILAEE